MTRTRTWRGVEEVGEEWEEEVEAWRGRGREGAGRGGSKHGRQVAAGRTAGPDPLVAAGREGLVVAVAVAAGAGSGGRPAQEAGSAGGATAAGRGGTTTHWSRRPALTPTATWSSWLWRAGWVSLASPSLA